MNERKERLQVTAIDLLIFLGLCEDEEIILPKKMHAIQVALRNAIQCGEITSPVKKSVVHGGTYLLEFDVGIESTLLEEAVEAWEKYVVTMTQRLTLETKDPQQNSFTSPFAKTG